MAQWDWWHLGSAGTQVRSPAWHGGLRIWYCCSCGLGLNCSSDLILGPGTPYAAGQPKNKKQEEVKAQRMTRSVRETWNWEYSAEDVA